MQDQDDEEKKPLVEEELLYRASESQTFIEQSLAKYNHSTYRRMGCFYDHLLFSQYIKIQNSIGLFTNQIVDIVRSRLDKDIKPLRPIAIKLDGGEGKDLLT